MEKRLKVFVGVSGGVDSSVALALLKNDDYDVTGVFLKVWSPNFLPCDWKEERRSAMRVCATLGVPFMTIDCEKEYKKEVVDYMIREYSEGRVPNPDVFCNKYVKFGVFLKKALEMGADYIATGHYSRKLKVENGKYQLQEAIDKNKDQSYFLYTLNQKQLSHTLFPVGAITKPEVRKLAKKFGLPTAEKKDSQGVCFLGKLDMKDFLSHYIKIKKGKVLNTKGEVVGFHDGAMFYTIGQRHGFTITKKSIKDPRFFIILKNLKKNTITIANKEKEKNKVYSIKNISLSKIHFINGKEPKFPLKTTVRIRYRQEKQKCVLDKKSKGYVVLFDNSQNAIAIGQSAVFYNNDVCLGGGIIEKTY
ncbi:MAG: tRNA 2-thiouridine(34) synthase MnmA [Candidatus Zambryskibacteria bacterium]|nr:tRNA 2-thiouridine(34) synthase MnmA [Candidatus Zambryskibacteria bacterium]